MRKLLTLSDKQIQHLEGLMKTTPIESFSEFVRFLGIFYEDHKREADAGTSTAAR